MGIRRQPVGTDRRFRRGQETADYGAPERWQHSRRALEATERAGVWAARALEEAIVDVLALRGWISLRQRQAALHFRRDYHSAGLQERLAGSYSSTRVAFSPFGPWDERTEPQEAAYRRWRHAVRAIGIVYSDLVITVACHDAIPAQQRVPALREGLEKLAKWYRLPKASTDSENGLDEQVDETAAR